MSNAEQFEELLRSDESLQAKLRTATEAYQGDKADERAVFDAIIAPLAAEADLPFTYDDAKTLVEADAELVDEELAAVAGGGSDEDGNSKSDCVVLGFGEDVDACTDDYQGAGACKVVGIGIAGF